VIARFDIDGFRIDTLRYLKGDLPRLFGNSMREFALSIGKKNFFTFGEVFERQCRAGISQPSSAETPATRATWSASTARSIIHCSTVSSLS
jgi:glycosidase